MLFFLKGELFSFTFKIEIEAYSLKNILHEGHVIKVLKQGNWSSLLLEDVGAIHSKSFHNSK